jgi:hypothetical protein
MDLNPIDDAIRENFHFGPEAPFLPLLVACGIGSDRPDPGGAVADPKPSSDLDREGHPERQRGLRR